MENKQKTTSAKNFGAAELQYAPLLAIAQNVRNSYQHPELKKDLPKIGELRYQLLENMLSQLHGISGSVMMADPMTDALHIATSSEIDQSVVGSVELKPGDSSVARWVYDNKAGLYVSETSRSQLKPLFYDQTGSEEPGSFMSVPLNSIDGTIGVVNINAKPGVQFTADHMSYGLLVAAYMAAVEDRVRVINDSDREAKDRKIYHNTVKGFLEAVRAKGDWLYKHSMKTAGYSLAILDTLGPENVGVKTESLGVAGELHDVGKIGVPEEELNKKGELTRDEYQVMKVHPLLSRLFISIIDPNGVSIGAGQHHQHWNPEYAGKHASYPDKDVSGNDISPMGRLLMLGDTIASMREDRPYRKGLSWEAVVNELSDKAGKQFDPNYALAAIETYRAGGFKKSYGGVSLS